jgi:HK97 family phage portal protein
MLWHGNGFVWVPFRNADGTPKAPLYVLNPDLVDYRDGSYVVQTDENEWETVADGELIHFRGMGPYDEKGWGVGVLARHAYDLGLASEVRKYASNTFRSGVPNGYLKVNNPNISEEQATSLKSKWMENHGSTRGIAVLNATTEFHPLTLDPVSMELVSMQKWTLTDIANAFGIEAHMIGGASDSNTYANVESRMINFAQFTLLPWARRIEATLNAETPRGTWLDINLTGLIRADTGTRFQNYAIAVDKGWLTVEEIRTFENLPPLPQGNPNG